ncbi:LOW QUALITY PROTEIN: putative protein phosphatase 1N [Trichechus inunguis]
MIKNTVSRIQFPRLRKAAFARLLERLLTPALELEEAQEEEEEGSKSPDMPQSFLAAPRRAQRPHGGAATAWGRAGQNWRAFVEDAHCAWLLLPGLLPRWGSFAVLDRHGGALAARFGARQVLEALGPGPGEPEGLLRTLRRACRSACSRSGHEASWGGSTAVVLLVSSPFLHLAHCGVRAVLSRAGAIAFSTEDHRSLGPREPQRIQDADGSLRRWRIECSMAALRALGDFAFKGAGKPPNCKILSAEHEVAALVHHQDEFLFLASNRMDAIFGASRVRLVTSRLRLRLAPASLGQLLDTCLGKSSLDNMSCILVCFPGTPKPCEEAIRRERALDSTVGSRVTCERAPEAQREGRCESAADRAPSAHFLLTFPRRAGGAAGGGSRTLWGGTLGETEQNLEPASNP